MIVRAVDCFWKLCPNSRITRIFKHQTRNWALKYRRRRPGRALTFEGQGENLQPVPYLCYHSSRERNAGIICPTCRLVGHAVVHSQWTTRHRTWVYGLLNLKTWPDSLSFYCSYHVQKAAGNERFCHFFRDKVAPSQKKKFKIELKVVLKWSLDY